MNKKYAEWYQGYQSYLLNPDKFSKEEVNSLQAQGMEFGVTMPDLSPEVTAGSLIKNFGSGIVQGFTTLPVGTKPTNDIDGIAHSIGHLLGFIGVIPGLGTLTGGLAKGAGLAARGMGAAKTGAKLTQAAPKMAAEFRSVPMYAATKFTDRVGKTAAANSVRNYFTKDWQRQALRHGAHLGAASVVSATWDNMKEEDLLGFLTNSFVTGVQGGIFGAGFGVIGSKVKLPSSTTGMETGDKILRGIAGGLFQTLPIALQGGTTPENVYNALLGTYFGTKAQPARYENAFKRLSKLDVVERAAYRNQEEFSKLPKKDQDATVDLLDNYFKVDQTSKGLWDAQDWLNNLFGFKTPKTPEKDMAEYQGKKVKILEENPDTKETLIQMPDGITQETVSSQYVKRLTEIKTKKQIEKEIKERIDTEVEPNDLGEEVSLPLARPVESFIKKITKTEGRELTADEYLTTLQQLNRYMLKETYKEKVDVETGEVIKKIDSWKNIEKGIINNFKHLKITKQEVRELKQFYVSTLNNKPITRYGYNALTGKLELQEKFDYNNNRINNEAPPTVIDYLGQAMGMGETSVMYVKNIWHRPEVTRNIKGKAKTFFAKPRQSKTGQFDFTAPENKGHWKNIVTDAFDKGYYPYSGKSDSDVLIFVRKNTGDNPAKELIRIKKEMTDAFGTKRKVGEKFNFEKEYKAIEKQALENMDISKDQFRDIFVSNVRWWELQNQRTIKDIAFTEGFISEITNFNKRQQPIFSEYYPLTEESFPDGFKYVVVNDYANSKDPQIRKLYKKIKDRIELSDGAVIVETRTNEAILSDHGLPEGGGFSKSFFVSQGKEGMLIGKHALHDAGPELSAAMRKLGINFIIPESVAKQKGTRKILDWNYNKKSQEIGFSERGKKLNFEAAVKDNYIYSMKAGDVLNSFGVYDGHAAKLSDPVRVFKAIWDVMVDSDIMALKEVEGVKYREGVIKEIKDWISKTATGKKEHNERLNNYLAKGIENQKELNAIMKNFENLGVVEINEAFKENTIAAKKFREAARKEIMQIAEPGMEKGELVIDAENRNLRDDIQSTATMLSRKTSRGKDGNVLSKKLADDHSTQIAKYFLKKVVRPKVHSSGKAIMRTFDLDLVQDKIMSKLVDNPDIFFLDNGFRKKPIWGITADSMTKPKWQSLEDRWADLQKLDKRIPSYKELEDVLTAAVVRTPMDNISALSALKFAGFTNRPGGGILLHPQVMKRLGGADLDIDSANFYFGDALPKVVKQLGRVYKDELVKIEKWAADNVKGGMKGIEKEFLIPETRVEEDSYLNMFDPFTRLSRANSIQTAALHMRGVAVNSRFTMKWLFQQAKENGGTFIYKIPKEGTSKDWSFEMKAKKSEMMLKAKSVAAINMAVDVAKYNGRMISTQELNAKLLEAGFKSITIVSPKGKRYLVNPKNYHLLWGKAGERYKISKTNEEPGVELNWWDTPAGALANTMRHFFSRDFARNRPYTHDEIVEAARSHPASDKSHLSEIAEIFKKLDYQDSMLNRVIGEVDGFAKFGRDINNLIKKDPEFTKYIQKDFKKVNFSQNIKRIKVLSEYYKPFSTMPGYDSYFNIATSSGRSRLAAEKTDWAKFFAKLDQKGLTFKLDKYIDKKTGDLKNKDFNSFTSRLRFIERQIKAVNDFISNDIYDLASVKNTYDFGKIHNMPGRDAKITNEIYKLANNLKTEFKEVRKSVKDDPEVSATSTALDRVLNLIKNEVEPSLYKFVDAYNVGKRESAEPMTYQGIKEYFDSILYGSIKGKETQDYYFVEMLVSEKVRQHHADIRADMFDAAVKVQPKEKLDNYLKDFPGNIIGNDAVAFEGNVLKGMRYDGKSRLDKVELKDKEVIKLVDDIKNVLINYKDSFLKGMKPDQIEEFFQSMLRKRNIGKIEDADIYALRGIRNEIVDWKKGRGFFRWFTKGGGRNIMKSINEIGDDDYLRVAGGHWLKPAETVAGDTYYNDIQLVSKRFPVTTTTKEGKLKKLYADAKVPMSHFEIMINDVANLLDHPNQIRNMDEVTLQKIVKQTSIKSIKNEEVFNKFHDLVTREIELDGAIRAKRELEVADAHVNKIENAERKIKQFMARRAETEALRKNLEEQEFLYDGKTRKGSEIIEIMKDRFTEVADWIGTNKVYIQEDFGDLLLKNAFVNVRKVQVNNIKYNLIDFKLDPAIEKIIKPLTKEGYVPRPGERQLTHDETMFFTYEQKLRRHAEDSIDPKTGKPKAGTEYVNDVNRTVKDVYIFKGMDHVIRNEDGSIIPGFEFLVNTAKGKGVNEVYINTFYRILKEKMDDINQAEYIQLAKDRGRKQKITPREEARFLAYDKYFKLLAADALDKPVYLEKFGALSGYISTRQHFIPYKTESNGSKMAYSQYDMDTLLAQKKIDLPFYIKEKRRHDWRTQFKGTGKVDGYVPHMDFDPIKLGGDIVKKMKEVEKSTLPAEEKSKALENLANRRQKLLHETTLMDKNISETVANSLLITDMSKDVGVKQLELLGGDRKPGNVLGRKFNLDGYARDEGIWGRYTDALNQATYNNLVGVLSEQTIRSFIKKRPMGKYTKDWEYFMRIYARDVIGAPSTISKEILDSETMNIKNTAWWFTSDQAWYGSKTARKFAHLWTGRGKPDESVRMLYDYKKANGEIREKTFDAWWKKQRDLFESPYDTQGAPNKENMEFFARRLKQVSMAEGKFAMATLLARAKSMVGNVFGGGTNNWVYTGSKNMFQAGNIEVWRSLNPNQDEKKGPVFRSMEDVYKWAETQGVIEGIISYEIGLIGKARPTNYEGFVKDMAKMWKDDAVTKVSVNELARKHNISENIVKKASWFMSKSERILRLKTFLSGYLQIRETHHPINFDLNDPYLINQAKKAVKAAQFFYHAPFRPAFARTSMGKIYSRFKLWAWNSVKFRRELFQEAKYRGFDPKSQQMERLQRMAMADMFVFGLANMLPYTMFDYSLPAPYSYMQDIADWAFGSDLQRDRAFYGTLPHPIAPLHELMPSILRGPEAIFGTFFTGAWDRLASYTLVSYMPFGMLGRDLYRAATNPAMLMEFTTGVPIHQIGRAGKEVSEGKKAPAYTPGYF